MFNCSNITSKPSCKYRNINYNKDTDKQGELKVELKADSRFLRYYYSVTQMSRKTENHFYCMKYSC